MTLLECKEGVVTDTTTTNKNECCMCGDYGLQHELFQCRLCGFRSQHRYCSNLYPKAGSYQVCNWCLKKESASSTTEEEETQNSSSISSSSHNDCKDKDKKNDNTQYNLKGHHHHQISKGTNYSSDHHHRHQITISNKPIKKHRSPDRLPLMGKRKMNFSTSISDPDHHKEGNLIRIPKFGEISQNRTTKKVFRGRIQRYKLLEEVCR